MEGEEKQKNFLEALGEAYGERKPLFLAVGAALLAFIFFSAIAVAQKPIPFTQYFLSVGQGDSEAVLLNNGAVVLIDGGPPNGRALRELEKILPFYKRSVDAVFITHPEEDHFGGLIEILKRFSVGVVITNGDVNETESFYELQKVMKERNIKQIALFAGDKVKQGNITLSVLWPPEEALRQAQGKRNENALVLLAEANGRKTLFLSDVPENIEEKFAGEVGGADIVKVGHHGSKTSSGDVLLYAVQPAVAVVEVGKNNYGHPTPEALERLGNAGAQIFRTDRDGTLGARFESGELKIFRVK